MTKRSNRVTIEDVARAAGVSTMTVSRVLNHKGEIREETRQRVLKIIDDMGYRPSRVARGLATNRTYILGVIVPDIVNPFFAQLVSGAQAAAWQRGYNVLLCHTGENAEREEAVLHLLEDTQVDGVLVCSARLSEEELLPLLEKQDAAILLNRQIGSKLAGVIRVNDADGAVQAVTHLLHSGRERIGLIAGPPGSISSQERRRGFALANEAAHHPENVALQIDCAPNVESGYQAGLALLQAHPDINGLFCYNDLVAVGALQACKELGKPVPDDIALVGCDDIPLAGLISPALTTLAVDKEQLGAAAIQLLIDRIQNQTMADETVVEQTLAIRESAP
ncbi:MAG: LacI family DNA-binding transcriptional regulator [Anaerolineaceae bacterium]|nr:LacI family DNA-binding transcriptional regulator [Anaerolineaceae bacterium]